MQITVVSSPSAEAGNACYPANSLPLRACPLIKLPLGAVRPRGWLKHQLNLMVDGMTGRLMDISKYLAPDNGWVGSEHDDVVTKERIAARAIAPQDGWFGTEKDGWEELPYWLRGFYSLARLTEAPRLIAEATHWIETVLTGQRADGYFGPSFYQNRSEGPDLWPHMVMLDALVRHHEVTGDSRIIPFMLRFFAFCRNLPDQQFLNGTWGPNNDWRPAIQGGRAGDMLPHLYWLYNRTGEEWLLPLATRFFHRSCEPAGEWLDPHVVNFTQRFAYPGIYATQSGDARHLDLSEYWYRQHLGTWGQQPRGIFAADENIRPGCVDPRQGFETCGFGEFAKKFYILGRITGNAIYADRAEDILFNHFSASMTSDLKALHYVTASNQPQLDASENHEYQNKGRQIDYSPWNYRCCQHNVAMTWPWLVENLWQASADGGLVAWIYAACEVEAKVAGGRTVVVREETDYPFSGEVKLSISCDSDTAFPLYLRIPGWCRDFRVQVNEQSAAADMRPGHYLRVERTWASGDIVIITMGMSLGLTTWPRTGSVTVDRGPLSYSLKIGERRQRCGGTDAWPEWELFPTTPWNYGLLLDSGDPLAGFQVIDKGQVADQPWTLETAPVEITAPAKRIPGWKLVNETADVLRDSPIRSNEPVETVTLVPLGCARLRISCFPVVRDTPDAREWK